MVRDSCCYFPTTQHEPRTTCLSRNKLLPMAALGCLGVLVLIVMTHPGHAVRQSFLVAAARRDVEKIVGAEEDVEPAPVGGVSVEDLSGIVLLEDAGARAFFAEERLRGVVVGDGPLCRLFLAEGDAVIEVEIAVVRGDPLELPSHALLEGLDLGERRARHHYEADVACVHVDDGAIEMVAEE